jgi:hypothetical protein
LTDSPAVFGYVNPATNMYTHRDAIDLIERTFPPLKDELHDEVAEGLLHLQVAAFSRLAQRAIDDGDNQGWTHVTSTFMELWRDCDGAVKNALYVSFLEHLDFKDGKKQRHWAFLAMSPVMRKAWEEMDAYNRRLHGGAPGDR